MKSEFGFRRNHTNSITDAQEKIDLIDLDPGIYSLLVEDGVSWQMEKIVVAR